MIDIQVQTKTFVVEDPADIDDQVNAWVKETESTIMDVKITDLDSRGVILIVVTYVPKFNMDELEKDMGLRDPDGLNVLDLSDFDERKSDEGEPEDSVA